MVGLQGVRFVICFGLSLIWIGLFDAAASIAQQPGATRNSASPVDASHDSKPPIVLDEATLPTLDIDYVGNNDPLQRLDIYTPKGAANAPVCVFVHGGGWSKRDKDEVGAQPKLLNAVGILSVSVNYRLVPAILHPENARDVAASVAWIHKNISRFGGDPNNIFLMGHSAGSHLVGLVGTDDRYLAAHGLHRDQLAGVISLDGSAFDIADRIKNGSPTVAENCRRAFGENPEAQLDGSPVHHVKNSMPLPPFLLIYLNEDSLNHKQSRRFAELVSSEGGSATLMHIDDGKTHQAVCDDLGTSQDQAGPRIVDFIRKVSSRRGQVHDEAR